MCNLESLIHTVFHRVLWGDIMFIHALRFWEIPEVEMWSSCFSLDNRMWEMTNVWKDKSSWAGFAYCTASLKRRRKRKGRGRGKRKEDAASGTRGRCVSPKEFVSFQDPNQPQCWVELSSCLSPGLQWSLKFGTPDLSWCHCFQLPERRSVGDSSKYEKKLWRVLVRENKGIFFFYLKQGDVLWNQSL